MGELGEMMLNSLASWHGEYLYLRWLTVQGTKDWTGMITNATWHELQEEDPRGAGNEKRAGERI